ncbi:unnamed protein product [Angiostrongylus costaricensis]|uniref:CID domain-containing protein n=1 Tax=Angiostrongylus costaricensis TaxID=334426 RepID=A0A0R3PXL2_ANGCS|nr:unnamed protein product [Angiostrongylus costaricensis]
MSQSTGPVYTFCSPCNLGEGWAKAFSRELGGLTDFHYFSILLVKKMDTESVKAFNAECKIEYKIPCLYVIDSIIRTSKHQLKEKDVFASRFLKNFSKTLSDLLSCPVCDQPRVIRTLNLWGANGVFTEEQLAPFKQQCRDMGIETDIERVERLVKGDEADMSRYGGAYGRVKEKDKRKRRSSASDSPTSSSHIQQQNLSVPAPSTTPPLPTPSQLVGVVPQLSHDPLLGAVSDLNNEPSDDVPPCGLSERKLLDMILDANFEFSGAFKNDIVLLRKAHGLICRALDARIRAVGDKPEIKDLLSSQFDYSDEEDDGDDSKKAKRPNVTKVCQEDLLSIARNLIEDPNVIAAFKHMHAERILVLNQAGLPSIAGLPTVQSLSGLQSLAGLQSINLAQLSALNQANVAQPNQALLNLLANNSLELLQQLAASGKTTLAGVPTTAGLGLLGAAPAQLIGPLSTASLAMVTDDNESDKDIRRKDRKRSRSRDRADHKKRRSRSKERKVEKVDRERRKLGLPAVQEGMTIIASKTLWFGRLPINCSENDIKAAVASVGDISRVNLIGSRACAYATMSSRKAAYDVLQKLARDLQIARKNVKVDWAKGAGMKENDLAKYWDGEYGISQIPWDQLPSDMEQFCEGSYLDVETLPPEKRHMYLDTGALTTTLSSAAPPSKTDTSSPSTPPTSMHASPIKSLVPDSPAALAPIPQAVPPPATFPPFMGTPPVHRPNPFMGPPPQMVPPPGFPMRLPMPPGIPPAMPPGMPGHMFGMPPGGPGGLMMPPPTGIPPPAPIPPPSSIPPPIAGVSGMHSGPMRTAPSEDTVDLEAVETAVIMEIDSSLVGKMLALLSQGPMKAQKEIVDARGTKRGIEVQREVGMKVEMRGKGITKEIGVVTRAEARSEEVGGMIRTIEAVADGTGEIDIEANETTEIGTAEIGTATETGIANDEEIVIDQRGAIEVVEIVKIVKDIGQGKGSHLAMTILHHRNLRWQIVCLVDGSEEAMVTSTTDVDSSAISSQPSYHLEYFESNKNSISKDDDVMDIEHSVPPSAEA